MAHNETRTWYPTKWIKIKETYDVELYNFKYEMYYFVPGYVIFKWAKKWKFVRAEYVYSDTRLSKSKAQIKLIKDRQFAVEARNLLKR